MAFGVLSNLIQALIQDFTAVGVGRVEGHRNILLMVKLQGLLKLHLKLHLIGVAEPTINNALMANFLLY